MTVLFDVIVKLLLVVGDVVLDRRGVRVGERDSVADEDDVREREDVTS